MPPSKPFRQGKFADLPQIPHKPHGFGLTQGRDVAVGSAVFGPIRVHVRVFGQGPPLLLVHGLMTSSYSWRYCFAPLGEHFTCYAVDLPGAGRSDRVRDVAYSPNNLATLLHELVSELDIGGCACIGNSMGGYLAMQLAMREPSAISRLVNLHSPGVPEWRLWALRLAFAVPGSAWALRRWIRRDPLRFAHSNVHYYDESLKSVEEAREYGEVMRDDAGAQTLVKYLTETMALPPMQAFQRELAANRATGKPFPVPLQLVYARQDPMVPPRFGRVFADQILGAQLYWLDGASHFAHVDATDAFLGVALPFLVDGGRT